MSAMRAVGGHVFCRSQEVPKVSGVGSRKFGNEWSDVGSPPPLHSPLDLQPMVAPKIYAGRSNITNISA